MDQVAANLASIATFQNKIDENIMSIQANSDAIAAMDTSMFSDQIAQNMMSIMANEQKIADVKTTADANTAKADANMMSIAAFSPTDITSLEMQVGQNKNLAGLNAAAISSNLQSIMDNATGVQTNK